MAEPRGKVSRCLHCGSQVVNGRRGLCNRHWRIVSIRNKYPRLQTGGDTTDNSAHMTEEELDALIAEQSKPENLPSWWEHDERMQLIKGRARDMSWLYKRGRL